MGKNLHLMSIQLTGNSFQKPSYLHQFTHKMTRVFIDFPEKYKFSTFLQKKFCFCFDIQNNIFTQHVVNLYFSGNSMNNLLPYFGLIDSRMRGSDTDLPV